MVKVTWLAGAGSFDKIGPVSSHRMTDEYPTGVSWSATDDALLVVYNNNKTPIAQYNHWISVSLEEK